MLSEAAASRRDADILLSTSTQNYSGQLNDLNALRFEHVSFLPWYLMFVLQYL